MLAVICSEPGNLAIAERDFPERRPGEVLLKILRVGLCGTDYHIFNGSQPYLQYPRVMGHELAASVCEVDENSTFAVGQMVVVNPYLSCSACIACRKGKPNCCTRITVLGVHADGGLCQYISVPETALIAAEGLTVDQVAMVEFLSVGAHAARRGSVTKGELVLVVGAGPIGVATALFCIHHGARTVLVERNPQRAAYAKNMVGIDETLVLDEGIEETLATLTNGDYFDCVFDATGNADAIRKGLDYVAHGGRYVLVSVVKQDISFPDPEFHKRETTLMGSRNATKEDFETVIGLIRDGTIKTSALNTQHVDFANIVDGFKALLEDQASVLKAIVRL